MIDHPISPPPELVRRWRKSGPADAAVNNAYEQHIATQAARWGADMELEACCQWAAEQDRDFDLELRAARRPKPPNKKQRGLTALEATSLKKDDPLLYQEILNAIEGLPDD